MLYHNEVAPVFKDQPWHFVSPCQLMPMIQTQFYSVLCVFPTESKLCLHTFKMHFSSMISKEHFQRPVINELPASFLNATKEDSSIWTPYIADHYFTTVSLPGHRFKLRKSAPVFSPSPRYSVFLFLLKIDFFCTMYSEPFSPPATSLRKFPLSFPCESKPFFVSP